MKLRLRRRNRSLSAPRRRQVAPASSNSLAPECGGDCCPCDTTTTPLKQSTLWGRAFPAARFTDGRHKNEETKAPQYYQPWAENPISPLHRAGNPLRNMEAPLIADLFRGMHSREQARLRCYPSVRLLTRSTSCCATSKRASAVKITLSASALEGDLADVPSGQTFYINSGSMHAIFLTKSGLRRNPQPCPTSKALHRSWAQQTAVKLR